MSDITIDEDTRSSLRSLPKAKLEQLLAQLLETSKSVGELSQLPLASVAALAEGDTADLELGMLLHWLQELQSRSDENCQLVEQLAKRLVDDDESGSAGQELQLPRNSTCRLGIVTLRGSCSWGRLISAAGGHAWEVGTSNDYDDYQRWELHRVFGSKPNTFAFRSVGSGNWLTAESQGKVMCNRAKLDAWEHWELYHRSPWNPGQNNVALRCIHGGILCQEPPSLPQIWPLHSFQGALHRMQSGGLFVVANRPQFREWETFTMADEHGCPLPDWLWKRIQDSCPFV